MKIKLESADLEATRWRAKIEAAAKAERTEVDVSQTARDRYVATLLGAEITVEVDTLGALLHGLDLLELITFCWDYKISLIVTGKIDLFRDGVIALLQREKAMLPATATGLFGALFSECRPGSGPPILYLNAFKPPKAPT